MKTSLIQICELVTADELSSSDTEHLPQAGPGIMAQRMGVRKGECREGGKVIAPSLLVLIKL